MLAPEQPDDAHTNFGDRAHMHGVPHSPAQGAPCRPETPLPGSYLGNGDGGVLPLVCPTTHRSLMRAHFDHPPNWSKFYPVMDIVCSFFLLTPVTFSFSLTPPYPPHPSLKFFVPTSGPAPQDMVNVCSPCWSPWLR